MKEATFTLLVLCCVISIYLVIGGLVFHVLETEKEDELLAEYNQLFLNFKTTNNISDTLMSKFMLTHQQGCNLGTPNRRWDLIGAIYFSGTVLTTIGYGHAAPLTMLGRVVFIIYALTSIPLYMLLLNLLLETSVTSLNKFLKQIYLVLVKKKLIKENPELTALPVSQVLLAMLFLFVVTVTISAILFTFIERWTYFESVYFAVVSFTTVGLGDFVPSKETSTHNMSAVYEILNFVLIFAGSIVTYIFMNLLATTYKSLVHYVASAEFISCVEIPEPVRSAHSSVRKIGIISRRSTISSGGHEDNTMGSFAAIQRAIDRIRSKTIETETGGNELKAVNTIEAILQNEYRKVNLQYRTDPHSRWQRAAAKARLSARRKYSNVYNSVLIEGDVSNVIASPSPLTAQPNRCASVRRSASRDVQIKEFRDNLTTPGSRRKVTINNNDVYTAITYDDIQKDNYEKRMKRRSTKSTYLPERDDLSEKSSIIFSETSSPVLSLRNGNIGNISEACTAINKLTTMATYDETGCYKLPTVGNTIVEQDFQQHSTPVNLQEYTDSESENDQSRNSSERTSSDSSAYFSSDITQGAHEMLENIMDTRPSSNDRIEVARNILTGDSNVTRITIIEDDINQDSSNIKRNTESGIIANVGSNKSEVLRTRKYGQMHTLKDRAKFV